MAILITKCCVCGREYKPRRQVHINGKGVLQEMVSHGICGKPCMNYTEVQLLVHSDKLNVTVMDKAFRDSYGRLFYKTNFLNRYAKVTDNIIELKKWDNVGAYASSHVIHKESNRDAVQAATSWSRKYNAAIVIPVNNNDTAYL